VAVVDPFDNFARVFVSDVPQADIPVKITMRTNTDI
jgi:hypothetical protein